MIKAPKADLCFNLRVCEPSGQILLPPLGSSCDIPRLDTTSDRVHMHNTPPIHHGHHSLNTREQALGLLYFTHHMSNNDTFALCISTTNSKVSTIRGACALYLLEPLGYCSAGSCCARSFTKHSHQRRGGASSIGASSISPSWFFYVSEIEECSSGQMIFSWMNGLVLLLAYDNVVLGIARYLLGYYSIGSTIAIRPQRAYTLDSTTK